MKIVATTSTDYNKKSPSFTNLKTILLRDFEEISPTIEKEIKKEIGNGLFRREWQHSGSTYLQDIFVGVNRVTPGDTNSPINKILISTGVDDFLEPIENNPYLKAKKEQIDYPITQKIITILNNYGINADRYFYEIDKLPITGDIGKIDDYSYRDKIDIKINKRTWAHYQKNPDSGDFEYTGAQ